MSEPITLGAYLRRERERRGLALKAISETTKVSVPLLEGLEADDISRWPGGIFRRAFVRSYAQCVGLDPDDVVRRFEKQHASEVDSASADQVPAVALAIDQPRHWTAPQPNAGQVYSGRTRLLGTAADLLVAMVLAFGSAAAGSRLLWPVLLIAGYYAVGVLLTGTSPMVALLSDQPLSAPSPPSAPDPGAVASGSARPPADGRHQPRRTNERPRHRRGAQVRVQ